MRRTGWWVATLVACAGGTDVGGETDTDDSEPGGGFDTDTVDDTDPTTGGVDCASEAGFLDLAAAPGAGDGYDRPSVEVTCDDDVMTVRSNAMIGYSFVQTTPNALVAGDYAWAIPRHPEVAAAPTDLPRVGLVAVAVNGVPIFGPNEAATPAETAWGDPVFNGIMDACLGHTAFVYHYHALSQQCLVQANVASEEPWTLAAPSADEPSPVLGWAADGFAIRGPYECADAACTSVVELRSGWAKTGDPATNAWDAYTWSASDDPTKLDRCNGHTGPDGDYHYHATSGFPYVLGCFTGTALDAGLDAGGGGPGGGGPGGGGPGGGPGGPP